MTRRSYSATAVPTTLVVGIGTADTSLVIADATGWPDGTGGPFTFTAKRGISGEEKILATTRSGTTLSGLTRGYEGTTAAAHAAGEAIEHTLSKTDLDEANAHINDTTLDQHTQYAKRGQGLAANVGAASRAGRLYIATDTEDLYADDGSAVHRYLSKPSADAAYQSKLFLNVKDYGALGNDSANDTAAIQAAITAATAAGGGTVFLPAGTYRITGLSITTNAVVLVGAGIYYGTTLRYTPTTGDAVTLNGAQHSGLRDILIDYANKPTAGYGITITGNAYQCFAERVRINQGFNGIQVNGATETRLTHVNIRQLYGSWGVYYTGTVGTKSFRMVIDDLVCDSPYQSAANVASIKTYANTTVYSVGDVIRQADGIYQCVTAGTSAGSGTGPSGGTFTANVADGTAAFRFISGPSLAWIGYDNYAYSLVVNKAALLNGYIGVQVLDSAATGTSYPMWLFGFDIETDHSFLNGFRPTAGEGFYLTGCWVGSALSSNGVNIGASIRGEVVITGTRIMGCAQHGVLVNGGNDITIANCMIGQNSVQSSAGFNGITVAANLNRFNIANNRIGLLVASATNLQSYGVFVTAGTSTNYNITGNIITGNVTGSISDGGTGSAKHVTDNIEDFRPNSIEPVPAVNGSHPSLTVQGANTDIDLQLIPKGAGRVRFGAFVVNADTPVTGYIEVRDAGGTVRRVAII